MTEALTVSTFLPFPRKNAYPSRRDYCFLISKALWALTRPVLSSNGSVEPFRCTNPVPRHYTPGPCAGVNQDYVQVVHRALGLVG